MRGGPIEETPMPKARAYAAHSATTPLAPWPIDRREPGPRDVEFAIKFCGVCHSDLHMARGQWPGVNFPVVPGHEIVGIVTRIGPKVTRFKVGDRAAAGLPMAAAALPGSRSVALAGVMIAAASVALAVGRHPATVSRHPA